MGGIKETWKTWLSHGLPCGFDRIYHGSWPRAKRDRLPHPAHGARILDEFFLNPELRILPGSVFLLRIIFLFLALPVS
jgi:hypothetical protein